MNLPPDIFFGHHASPVAPPVTPSPARALIQELGAVLQGRLELTLSLVLNPCLPLMANEPAGDEVVIISVEDVWPPFLRLETLEEVMARENLGAVCPSAARHARGASINVVGGRDLEVATLDVCGAKPVEDASRQRTVPNALYSLTGSNAAHLRIFERRENPGHQGGGPGHIIIGHDGDLRLHIGESLADLKTLVGNGSGQNLDVGMRKAVGELLKSTVLVACGDKE